jgi:predicted ATPase
VIKSLAIKNFRSLADFEVAKLGRVNLIVGKNNSGKSSVLEALRIYAANGQRSLLEQIASGHDEKFQPRDVDREELDVAFPFEDFFSGRRFPANDVTSIAIGESANSDQLLRIEHGWFVEDRESVTSPDGVTNTRLTRRRITKNEDRLLTALVDGIPIDALYISKGDRATMWRLDERPARVRAGPDLLGGIPCSVIPTQFVSIDELADEWDKIGLTKDKQIVIDALKIIAPEFEELMFVKRDDSYSNVRTSLGSNRDRFSRTAMLRLSNFPRPVPLNSLGDGMLRILQLVLKVFSARGGFLLIDEFENGLHYAVQEKIWALLFELANKLDIQVFATTHSWDCIESFAKVAIDRKDIEGVLFRVGKSVRVSDKDRIIATVFDEDQLFNITQSDVEVR